MSLRIKDGETKTLKFTVTYSNGTVYDASGYEALAFSLKSKVTDTTSVISKTTNDFDATSAATGIFYLTLIPSDTSSVEANDYIGEFELTMSTSNIIKTPNIDIRIDKAII